MVRTKVILGSLTMAMLTAAAPAITNVDPIVLHPGVNRVPAFLPGGGTATIIEAWRGNGNAHGFHVWMVLGGASEGNRVGVAGLDAGPQDSSDVVITDNPFDGERMLGAVRFVTARLGGRAVSLLVRADLDRSTSGVLADHATATVRWWRLDRDPTAVGRPTYEFVPVGEQHTTRRYCNAELALRDWAAIPLPHHYAGANRVDGCFAGG